MLDNQTKKRIDDCRDILVGKITDPKSQVEQITIAMIYKFMDDMDIQSEEYGGSRQFFVGDYQKYSWSKIFSPRVDADEMLNLYGEGIEKMSENPNLNPLFRSIFKDAYLPYRDPETLKLFLKTIDGFSYEHSEKLGDAYEYLLSVLGSQGGAGQFRTPRHIIDFIVDLVEPKKGDRILDPACGTSGFLISSYKRILERNTDKKLGDKLSSMEKKQLLNSIYGYDLDPNMVRLSLVNLFLHGFTEDELNVIEYDSLTSEDRWNEYFDVILANPPFMTPKGGIRPHNRFSIKSNRAEVLFVNYIMEHLTPKGRAGIVVPEGIIFQSGTAYKQLRKSLIEKYLIGVVSLPGGVFNPYSGVKTSILILDRELSQKTDKIFFGKIENDGYDLGSQRREIDKNDLPKIKDGVLEYIHNIKDGIEEEHPNLSYVSKEEMLNSNDIGLSFERYTKYNRIQTKYEKVLLGDKKYFEIVSGGTPKTSIDEYWNGRIPWISLVDLPKDERITRIRKTRKTITELGLNKSSSKIIPKGSIVVSTRATIGRVGITEIELSTNQGFKNIIINDYEKVNPIYISYVMTQLKSRMIELASGGTFKEISKSNFETLEIPLPPLKIQKEIVEELEQYQKVIDGAKQVVDNYKPNIEIDESWEIKTLGELGKVSMCKRIFKEQTNTKGDVPFYKIGTFGGKANSFINYDLFNEFKSKYSYPKKGEILISTSGTIGKIVEFDGKDSYFQDSNIVWISHDESIVRNSFLKFYFQQINWQPERGVTIARLYNKIIDNTSIYIPPIKIQNQIVEKLEEERKIIQGNKKLIETYTQKIEDRINKIWGE